MTASDTAQQVLLSNASHQSFAFGVDGDPRTALAFEYEGAAPAVSRVALPAPVDIP